MVGKRKLRKEDSTVVMVSGLGFRNKVDVRDGSVQHIKVCDLEGKYIFNFAIRQQQVEPYSIEVILPSITKFEIVDKP